MIIQLQPLSTGRGDYDALLSCVLTLRTLLNFIGRAQGSLIMLTGTESIILP